MSTAPLLEVRDLDVTLPFAGETLHPVRGVSFSLAREETLCIVGESGCGKSLTALALMNLLPKGATRSASNLSFDGDDLLDLPAGPMRRLRGAKIAMIFQEPMTSLNPTFTIGNMMVEVYRRHRGGSRSQARDRAVYLLERTGITAAPRRLGQYPHQLSGGLRQRVMIAMALMCGPAVIVADEPTTALDVTIQAQILHLLDDLRREFGMGLILISHDLGVVSRIADRVLIMYAGQVVEEGTATEIFENPQHPYTKGLLDCIPMPGDAPRRARLGTIPGVVPTISGTVRGCLFRNRCGHAHERCQGAPIPLIERDGRRTRCVLVEETSADRRASEAVG